MSRTRSGITLPLIAALALTATALVPGRVAQAHAIEPPPFQVQFPQETQVTDFSSTFGLRRSTGRRHQGNDLMAPKMTQVYAAGSGVVVAVAESRTAGRYVQIDHRDGWSTMYVHLNNDNPGTDDGDADWSLTVALGVEVGTWVAGGQLIGWVGDSGNAEGTEPHTHFEIARDGRAVDPYHYLTEAFERGQLRYLQMIRSNPDDVMTR